MAPDGLAGEGKANLRLETADYAYMSHIPLSLKYAFTDPIQAQPQTLLFTHLILSAQTAGQSPSQSAKIRHTKGVPIELEGPIGDPSSLFDVDVTKESEDCYQVTATLTPRGVTTVDTVTEPLTFHAFESGRKSEIKLKVYIQGSQGAAVWYEGLGYQCNYGPQWYGGCEGEPATCTYDKTLATNTRKTTSNSCAIKKQWQYGCKGTGSCDDGEGPNPSMCQYQVGGPYSCTGFWSSTAGCAG